MTLSAGDYAAIAGLMAAFVGVPMSLVVANLRGMTKRIETVEARVRDVEEKKVDLRDFWRVELSTRKKVDRVSEQVAGLHSKLDAMWGMGAAMNRVAEGISKMAETAHGN